MVANLYLLRRYYNATCKKVGGDPEILEIVDKVLEAKEAGAKAPPMPRPPSLQNSLPLVDIPCIILMIGHVGLSSNADLLSADLFGTYLNG